MLVVHERQSLVENCALTLLTVLGVVFVLAVLGNLDGLKRYIRIKQM